jgi:hypothetical protein
MTHKTGLDVKIVNHHCTIQIMEAAGFKNIRLVDYDGRPFSTTNDQVKRYLMVCEK